MLTGRIPQNEHNRKFMERVIEEAKQALKEPETSLPYTEYRMFGITGERVGYEAHYIKRRKRLGLFLLMCLWEEDDKAYFDALLNTIWAMLDEFSWALPAHLLTVPEERKYRRLDLFAAETALALNDVLSLIGDRLPDDVKTRIHTEVRRRILVSFFSKNEVNYPHSNWSAVQLSGILAGLSIDGTEEEFEKAVPKMLEIAGYFTGSYPEDGCCLEGALYWLFGFGYYVYAADLMSELSGGKIDLLAGEKCRKIANYWTKITLDGNNVLPYSDAPHQCNYHIGLIHYLKKRFPEIAVPGIEEEMRYGEDSRYRLPDMLRNLYWYDESILPCNPETTADDFPDAQWYTRRGEISFSIKGGHNDEPHNHIDVGSFIIYKNGKYYADDPGWGEYYKDYFGPHRYENVICAAEGHSLPTVGGLTQRLTDATQKAQAVEVTENKITLDIGIAYADGLSLLRTLERKDGDIVLTDDCRSGKPICQHIVTRIAPTLTENGVKIDEMTVTSDRPADVTITETSFIPRRIISAGDAFTDTPLYLIDFKPKAETAVNSLHFTFE